MMKHGSVVVVLAVVAACGSSPARPERAPARTVVAPPPVVAPPAPREDPLVPLDPAIKRGTLPNGLTYYVVKHSMPEHRAAL
jgi:hypothetical protein